MVVGLNNHYLNDSCAKNRHVCMSQHQQINGDLRSRSICYGMIMRAPQKKMDRARSSRRLARSSRATLASRFGLAEHLKLMNLTELLCMRKNQLTRERGCEETMEAKVSSPWASFVWLIKFALEQFFEKIFEQKDWHVILCYYKGLLASHC